MHTKIKIALAAALVAVTSSVALAQPGFDPNLGNRYPAYDNPGVYGYTANSNVPVLLHQAPHAALQSAPVRLQQNSDEEFAGGLQAYTTQYYRRIPVNQGDTSYGQDWAESYGGGF